MAKILIVEPFYGGSHQRWIEGLIQHSSHQIELLSLPARHWKWRMHGAAISLAEAYLSQKRKIDLILASDMLDLATFSALIAKTGQPLPSLALYMHENQLTYPWSPTDEDTQLKRDRHYAWINYSSCLVADHIFFNSAYHQASFLGALPTYLKEFPDYTDLHRVQEIEQKSQVLYLGLNLSQLDHLPNPVANQIPHLLWNHRWEYDKNPELFFRACFQLVEEKIDFRLIVLGEQYRSSPKIFAEAKEKLAAQTVHWGYVANSEEYFRWLKKADILPVSNRQDFFGGSIVEAIYAGVYPLLPKRLAYPEHISEGLHPAHFYEIEDVFYSKLKNIIQQFPMVTNPALKQWVARYDWKHLIRFYDAVML